MKSNRLYIAVIILAAAFFTGCEEYVDTVTPGESFDDDYAVRFLSSNPKVWELDPIGDLTFALTVTRDNKGTAIEVPLTEVADTSDVFTVPSSLSFAADEDTVTLVVTMDASADKGVVYGLEIEVAEDFSKNPYKIDMPSYSGEIAISVWSTLGTVQFYDAFSFYSVAEVTLEQNGDNTNVYRITSPYKEDILTEAEWGDWIGGTTQDKIVFTVGDDNTVTWEGFYYTNLIYQAVSGQEIKAYEVAELGADPVDPNVAVYDGADIQYLELHPYFYIDGVGGYGEYAVYLGMPGYDLAGAIDVPLFVSTD
ncbi:MAG: hypothetical protein P1P82_06995 [Bacteroidales bacterium]|nr:hypothetical protein [Bacteroidales bacterium]MDT8432799.1 hypothetical protein [Bacteroidales bacterium]